MSDCFDMGCDILLTAVTVITFLLLIGMVGVAYFIVTIQNKFLKLYLHIEKMHKVVEGVVKASMMINPTLHRIRRNRRRARSANYEPTDTTSHQGTHRQESYTPLAPEEIEEEPKEENQVSIYEDGRSTNHSVEQDYEVAKTNDRRIATPDLIRQPQEANTTQREIPNQQNADNAPERQEVKDKDEVREEDRKRDNTDSTGYIVIIPDECDNDDNEIEEEDHGYSTGFKDESNGSKAEGGKCAVNIEDRRKVDADSRHYSSDYETLRSSQLDSSIVHVGEGPDDFDSEWDEMSESSYYDCRRAMDDVEYHNGEWAQSFKDLQVMFQRKDKESAKKRKSWNTHSLKVNKAGTSKI